MLDESIDAVVDQLFELLPNSEFAADMKALVKNAWQPGRGYVESFATMMTSLLGRYGLIFLDPLDPELKQLAAPLYSEAARRAPEIATAIEQRSSELESAGYHAQVLATANSFPLFLHDEDGARHAVVRVENGKYKAKEIEQEYTAEELADAGPGEAGAVQSERDSARGGPGLPAADDRLLRRRRGDRVLRANCRGLSRARTTSDADSAAFESDDDRASHRSRARKI